MKRFILTALLGVSLGLGLSLILAAPSMAVHKGSGDLTCGNCHTMHSSQGGDTSTTMGGATGSFLLLRTSGTTRETIHNFCLQCHSQDGSQGGDTFNTGVAATTPPKVHRTTGQKWADGGSFGSVGAGGEFQGTYGSGTYTPPTTDNASANDALGVQHSIGRTTVKPPGNNTSGSSSAGANTALASFTCTTCHDPHGTASTTAGINRFRNLKGQGYIISDAQNPFDFTSVSHVGSTSDLAKSYVGGVAVGNNSQGTSITTSANIWPIYQSAGTQNVYLATGLSDSTDATVTVGMSRFCAQCHGAWHEATATAGTSYNRSGNDWTRHPTQNRFVDSTPLSGGSVSIFDFTHYSSNTINPVGYRLPAAQSQDETTYYANDANDRVFCLSCHFAHGSPNNDILRWAYTSAVSAGSQIGNMIASNVGCQQCHNR